MQCLKPEDAYGISISKLPTVTDVKQEVECHCKVPEAIVRAVNEMVDLSLFKSTVFLLIAAASLLTYTAIYIPFLLIKSAYVMRIFHIYFDIFLLSLMRLDTSGTDFVQRSTSTKWRSPTHRCWHWSWAWVHHSVEVPSGFFSTSSRR